jgi:hypothetical protein
LLYSALIHSFRSISEQISSNFSTQTPRQIIGEWRFVRIWHQIKTEKIEIWLRAEQPFSENLPTPAWDLTFCYYKTFYREAYFSSGCQIIFFSNFLTVLKEMNEIEVPPIDQLLKNIIYLCSKVFIGELRINSYIFTKNRFSQNLSHTIIPSPKFPFLQF